MRHFVFTEPGFEHRNEDVVRVAAHLNETDGWLCALADGQGGRAGGAAAAQIAVARSLAATLSQSPETLLDEYCWYPVVAEADEAVAESDEAGLTTLVCAFVTMRAVCGVSCGDSAALLVQADKTARLLTEHQRKNPPVGSGAAFPVAFGAVLTPPWKILLLSDGVWRSVGWETIERLAGLLNGETLTAALRESAKGAGGGRLHDDFSLILLQGDE